jgi:phosphoglycerate kinase
MQLEPPRRATTVAVGAVSNPTKPFAAIVGGSKVSSKIGVIEALLQQCDKLVMG